MSLSKRILSFCLFVFLLGPSTLAYAQEISATPTPTPQESPTPGKEDSSKSPFERAFDGLSWRSIGPANMGGRTADVEGVPGNPNVVYAATASGGLFKTVNGGVTWKPIFERQGTISIGDIALAPSAVRLSASSSEMTALRYSMIFTPQGMSFTANTPSP